jgi:hypothetical protein
MGGDVLGGTPPALARVHRAPPAVLPDALAVQRRRDRRPVAQRRDRLRTEPTDAGDGAVGPVRVGVEDPLGPGDAIGLRQRQAVRAVGLHGDDERLGVGAVEEPRPDAVVAHEPGGLQAVQPVDDPAAVHLDEDGGKFRRVRRVDEKPDMSGVRSALAQGNPGRERGDGDFACREFLEISQV